MRRIRIVRTLTVIALLLCAVACITYALSGHALIDAMYHGKAFGPLNHVISYQALHPVTWYFTYADALFRRACVAALTGIALFFLFGTWPRRAFGMFILFTAGTLVLYAVYIARNAFMLDLPAFEKSVRTKLKRSGDLAEKAKTFNQREALRDLGSNAYNGFYYRFDEHAEDAVPRGGNAYGERHAEINEELRTGIGVATPLSLGYALTLPEEACSLRFGCGIEKEGESARFRVLVRHGKTEEEVFSQDVTASDGWHDSTIDLSRWPGKNVEIIFETAGTRPAPAFWSNPLLFTPPAKRFNVIFIIEDALRADHLSCYGYHRKTTPFKDVFAKRGVLFLNAFSQGLCTKKSMPSVMTSLYPTATRIWRAFQCLHDSYLTLAEVMRSQGFDTFSFIQNPESGTGSALQQGICNLFDHRTMGRAEAMLYDNEKLLAWIRAHSDRNFFLFLHAMGPHGPYDPPGRFNIWYKEPVSPYGELARYDKFDAPWVTLPTTRGRRMLYDGKILWHDYFFGKLVEMLQEQGLLDDTLIVFTADHGEHLGERGLWGHRKPAYIQAAHVPLLLVYPKGLPEGVRVREPVQLIDVMPTVLELAGIEGDGLLMQGDSLLPLMRGEALPFWRKRICFSEEFRYNSENRADPWGALFYGRRHILNTSKLRDRLSRWIVGPHGERLYLKKIFSMRIFDYFNDPEERQYNNSFTFDLFLRLRASNIIRRLKEKNGDIWFALTGGVEKTVTYSPEDEEYLKSLGYLQ